MDEFSDRKRCREDNPKVLTSPEQNTNKKKKRKKRNKGDPHSIDLNAEHPQLLPETPNEKGAEPKEARVEQPLPQVCPNHNPVAVVVDAAVPLVPENKQVAEPNEATATPHKKKKRERKNKNVLNEPNNAEHPQLCSPTIPIQESERKNTNEKVVAPIEAGTAVHPQVCPNSKHELEPPVDTAVPIAPQKKTCVGPNKTSAEHPQACAKHEYELAPPRNEKAVGVVGSNETTAHNAQLLLPVPDPTATPQKKNKWEKKKKNVLNRQGEELKEPNSEQIQLCNPVDPPIVIGLEPNIMKEKGAEVESNEANAEQRQLCPKHESAVPEKKEGGESNETHPKCEPAIPVDPEKKKGAAPNEATTEHPELLPVSDPTPSKDTPWKRRRERKKKTELKPQGAELKSKNENGAEPNEANAEHPQVCPKLAPAPPLDIAIPVDPEKKKGAEPNEANAEDPQVCHKPESLPPVELAIAINPDKKEEAEPSEAHAEHSHPQAQPQPCSKPDTAPPGDPTTPVEQSRRKQRDRRGRKRKMCLEEKVESQRKQYTLNQTQPDPAIPLCPKPASTIDQAIPTDRTIPVNPTIAIDSALSISPKPVTLFGETIPVSPATPIDTEQNMMKKKRRKKKRKRTLNGAEPIEHDTKPPGTPIQTSICPIGAPPIGPVIPTDPEQKTRRKKRKKKRKSAPKSEGTEPDKQNAEPTVETPVWRTKGLTVATGPFKWPVESSMRESNAKPPAKTQLRRSKRLAVTEVSFKQHGESSMICRACQQPGHKFEHCPRLKCLSKDEEICFFCGEIGHSLGKCSVYKAGGGRFAKCLFCLAQGHFSNNCPRNGHGIDPMVVAANGPINKMETEGKTVAEVTNM